MYTEPVIVYHPNRDSRAYVKVLINGQRYWFYNGKRLGLSYFPNRQQNPAMIMRLLITLQYELRKKLEKGWMRKQGDAPSLTQKATLVQALKTILKENLHEDISDQYRAGLA